jgi:hypothetical protein
MGRGLREGWQRYLCMIIFAGRLVEPAVSQQLTWMDSIPLMDISVLDTTGNPLLKGRISQNFAYCFTLSGLFFVNRAGAGNSNNIAILQDLAYEFRAGWKKHLWLTTRLDHHLGACYFFDSIAQIHLDDNTLSSRIEWKIVKGHSLFIASGINTRLFRGYDYHPNEHGCLIRIINASFLTPMIVAFSAGIRLEWPFAAYLNFGLSAGKFTWIRDKTIFEAQQVDLFYGVGKGKRYLLEYGLNMECRVDREFSKWLHWEFLLMVFKNINLPADVNLKNRLEFRILKYVRVNLQTRVIYESQVSRKVQFENLVSVGFRFSL